MGENSEEQRSLTGQKAEPLGMKFTLFLSGHENRGKPFDLPELKRKTSYTYIMTVFTENKIIVSYLFS